MAAGGIGLCLSLRWAAADLSDSRRLSPTEHIYRSLMDGQEHILMVGCRLTPAQLGAVWNAAVYEHADLFFIADRYEFVTVGDTVVYVTPQYALTGDELDTARTVYEQAMADILATVDPNWSDLQTALYLHDYLCMHFAYDETITRYTAYDLLTDGTGVCQAYTLMYGALLEACGIEWGYGVSHEMNHAWNVVTLDGKRYNVDVTYDDPTNHPLGRAAHTHFLVSDAELSKTHSFTAAEGFGQCSDTAYDNALWRTAASGFVPLGDSFYYIDKGTIRRWDGSSSQAVMTIYATWFTDHGDGSYWEGNHSSLWAAGDLLLYNTPDRIVALDPATGITRTVYGHSGSGSIFGFTYIDGVLTLQISHSPNQPGERTEIELEI